VDKTLKQFRTVFDQCEAVFLRKHQDYGSNWRIFRPASLTDQMYIKAMRIRTIEETGVNKVQESVEGEYMALVNYGILSLIQLSLSEEKELELSLERVTALYQYFRQQAEDLMLKKNHDYGEAWRQMRVSSYVDLILSKIYRTKQIEDLNGKTLVSEGIDANYMDMINYAIFALIQLGEC